MDEKQNQEKANKGKSWLTLIIICAAFLLPIVCMTLVDWFVTDTSLVIGVTGFVQKAIFRGFFAFIALIIAIVCVVKIFLCGKAAKQIAGYVICIILCAVFSYLILRPLVLDGPYLENPEVVYLNRLDFDRSSSTGDSPTRYYVRGYDMNGEKHSFEITKKRYNEGIQRNGEEDFIVKASYLPHTKVLLSLEYISELDEAGLEEALPSSGLADNWDSFMVQINGAVYTIPCPLTDFLENGWMLSDENTDAQLEAAGASYSKIPRLDITLTRESGQELSLIVFNDSEETIPIEDGTVGCLYAFNGNYDFSGDEFQLPGGLKIGWSTREDVINQYGEPSTSYGSSDISYEVKGSESTKYWDFTFNSSGFIRSVRVQNHEYLKDYK